GKEQLAIFVTTVVAVLATDLLVGIAIGIALKFVLHLWNGAPLGSLFQPRVAISRDENGRAAVSVSGSAVFSNWIGLKRRVEIAFDGTSEVVVDLSETRLVDHTVMERLHALKHELAEGNRTLVITGLDDHQAFSHDPYSTRKRLNRPR